MAKINIIKPTGSDTLSLLSAFRTDTGSYVIFDSEKVGSMGLPIIYIAKLMDKLEKVADGNEWQSVKNYLKGIINGTNFEYFKLDGTVNADEVYYTPLTLPQSSFDLIKNRYVVEDTDAGTNEEQVLIPQGEELAQFDAAPSVPQVPEPTPAFTPSVDPVPSVTPNVEPQVPATPSIPNVSPVGPMTEVAPEPVNMPVNQSMNPVPPQAVAPVMPSVEAASNTNFAATPNVVSNIAPEVFSVASPEPSVEPVQSLTPTPMPTPNPVPASTPVAAPVVTPAPEVNVSPNPVVNEPQRLEEKTDVNIFMQDKETFLKACENMFDALVSKYQKQLEDLENREQALKAKEQDIQAKLSSANEHLANAAAREQVANIAHDNAQRVMDISNLMPNNPIAS